MTGRSLGIYIGVTVFFTATLNTHAAMIADNYIGSKHHGYGDVIGRASLFDSHYIDVGFTNTSLTVDIYSNFAGRADDGLYARYTRSGKGIGYSDLFLASSWQPFGPAPYLADDASTGTRWNYVFALDDRWNPTGGTGTLYALANTYTSGGGGSADILTSNYHMTGAIFRDNQEVSINTASANITKITTGNWSVNEGFLRVEMDLFGTSLLQGNIALHWGPTCANDVVEGITRVPEPGVLVLMATGLLGLVGSRRIKRKACKK